MPPPTASKASKAGKNSLSAPGANRQSRSRNTTPNSIGGKVDAHIKNESIPPPPEMETESKYLDLPMSPFPKTTYESIVDPAWGTQIPDSKSIDAMIESLNKLLEVAEARGSACDRGMRLLSQRRKETVDFERGEMEKREREDAEERARLASKKRKSGKRHDKERERERPLTHGAHGLAPQDGSQLAGSASPKRSSATKSGREMSASSSLSPVEQGGSPPSRVAGKKAAMPKIISSEESSDDEHQPAPAPATTHLTTFGEDPWVFPDPTEYEIKPITPGMSEDEKKKIFSVADYPHDDLADKIPGTPPDEDFSTKKNIGTQVQANTFATYVEPYLRPFTEEDLAWVRERHSNPNDFIVPRRGKRHYQQVWDEEDNKSNPRRGPNRRDNEARGSLEDLDEAVAETDQVSIGPLGERVLSLLRPENRPAVDSSANGASNDNADLDNVLGIEPAASNAPPKLPPATQMPDSNSEAWKKASHPQLTNPQIDERLKQELQFCGFLPMDVELDYDAGFDDEVAARERYLTERLAEVTAKTRAKKSVLEGELQHRLAYQEFSNIKDDLDSQVVSNFGKRTRSLSKNKKNKRPGGAGGGSHAASGMAKPAIGDATKAVLDKRKKWNTQIGPVFAEDNFSVPRAGDPESKRLFAGTTYEAALRREKQALKEEIAEAEAEGEEE